MKSKQRNEIKKRIVELRLKRDALIDKLNYASYFSKTSFITAHVKQITSLDSKMKELESLL